MYVCLFVLSICLSVAWQLNKLLAGMLAHLALKSLNEVKSWQTKLGATAWWGRRQQQHVN